MHDPAILTAVLERDVYAEMISDGFHLHPPIIRLLLKTKGWNRMIAYGFDHGGGISRR